MNTAQLSADTSYTYEKHGDAIDDCCHHGYDEAIAGIDNHGSQPKAHVPEPKDQPDSQQGCLSVLQGIQRVYHHCPNLQQGRQAQPVSNSRKVD